MKAPLRRPLTGHETPLLWAIPTLIWGSTWLAITFQLGVVAPAWSVAYRFGLAALMLALWCRATGRSLRFPRRDHAFLAAQGVLLFGANYVAVYEAERYLASGLVAVLFSIIAFFNPIGARLVFGSPISTRTLVAASLGVGGVALVFLPEVRAVQEGANVGLGVFFGAGATVLASGGNLIVVRNHRANLGIPQGTAWAMGWGAVTAALIAAASGAPIAFDARPAYLASLAYLAAFGSVVAFLSYFALIRRVGVGPAAYAGAVTPIIAVLLSTLFEDYTWTPAAIIGIAFVFAGNVVALKR